MPSAESLVCVNRAADNRARGIAVLLRAQGYICFYHPKQPQLSPNAPQAKLNLLATALREANPAILGVALTKSRPDLLKVPYRKYPNHSLIRFF